MVQNDHRSTIIIQTFITKWKSIFQLVASANQWKEIVVARNKPGHLQIFMVYVYMYDQPVLDIVIVIKKQTTIQNMVAKNKLYQSERGCKQLKVKFSMQKYIYDQESEIPVPKE